MKIINNKIFLDEVKKKGEYLRKTLHEELKKNEFFLNHHPKIDCHIQHLLYHPTRVLRDFYNQLDRILSLHLELELGLHSLS
jgi:hypothetical protein